MGYLLKSKDNTKMFHKNVVFFKRGWVHMRKYV